MAKEKIGQYLVSTRQKLIPYVHDGQVWPHFFVDTKTQVIYFLKSHGGRKIKFTTKEKVPNGVKAKRYANAEFDRRTGKNAKVIRTLVKDELEAWLLLKQSEGHKYDTLNNIKRAKEQIEKFWGGKFPSEINRDSFAEWCMWWTINEPSIEMENAIKYFKNFCRYLHEKVVGDRPLLAAVPTMQDPNRKRIRAKRARKKERVFTFEEFKRVHSTAVNEIEALIPHLMYTMATRVDETLKLDFGRILLDEDPPLYRWTADQNKAEKIGEHALHSSLIEPLSKLRDRRKAEGTNLLFPQSQNNQKALREQQVDWSAWRVRAGINFHWTPHTFRHTCLTNLFNNAANPQAVICKLYRVSLGVAMETYVKVTRESMLSIRDSIEVRL